MAHDRVFARLYRLVFTCVFTLITTGIITGTVQGECRREQEVRGEQASLLFQKVRMTEDYKDLWGTIQEKLNLAWGDQNRSMGQRLGTLADLVSQLIADKESLGEAIVIPLTYDAVQHIAGITQRELGNHILHARKVITDARNAGEFSSEKQVALAASALEGRVGLEQLVVMTRLFAPNGIRELKKAQPSREWFKNIETRLHLFMSNDGVSLIERSNAPSVLELGTIVSSQPGAAHVGALVSTPGNPDGTVTIDAVTSEQLARLETLLDITEAERDQAEDELVAAQNKNAELEDKLTEVTVGLSVGLGVPLALSLIGIALAKFGKLPGFHPGEHVQALKDKVSGLTAKLKKQKETGAETGSSAGGERGEKSDNVSAGNQNFARIGAALGKLKMAGELLKRKRQKEAPQEKEQAKKRQEKIFSGARKKLTQLAQAASQKTFGSKQAKKEKPYKLDKQNHDRMRASLRKIGKMHGALQAFMEGAHSSTAEPEQAGEDRAPVQSSGGDASSPPDVVIDDAHSGEDSVKPHTPRARRPTSSPESPPQAPKAHGGGVSSLGERSGAGAHSPEARGAVSSFTPIQESQDSSAAPTPVPLDLGGAHDGRSSGVSPSLVSPRSVSGSVRGGKSGVSRHRNRGPRRRNKSRRQSPRRPASQMSQVSHHSEVSTQSAPVDPADTEVAAITKTHLRRSQSGGDVSGSGGSSGTGKRRGRKAPQNKQRWPGVSGRKRTGANSSH